MTRPVDELARRRWFRAKVHELGELLRGIPGHRHQMLLTDDHLTRPATPAPPESRQSQVVRDDDAHDRAA